MGVYIKDMKMPEKCCACPMCKEDDLGYMYSYCTGKCNDIPNLGLGEKPEWCPLVEIPTPHGDLVDKDTFMSWYKGSKVKYPITTDHSAYDTMMMYEIFYELEDMPVIVEAEN